MKLTVIWDVMTLIWCHCNVYLEKIYHLRFVLDLISFVLQLGYTALHRAAAQGHLEVIKVLIAEGCLLDKQDDVVREDAIHINGLMQQRQNSSALAMELCLSYTNPSIYVWVHVRHRGFNSSLPWTKWPPFRRRHFQIHFCEWKVLYFD